MSVRVINDTAEGMSVLYCSTSMWAFGPVFHDEGHTDPGAAALCFLHWWDGQGFMDPRTVDDSDLEQRQLMWLGAVVGGEWKGSAAEECKLCHGDLDFRTDADVEREAFDMSGSTPGAECQSMCGSGMVTPAVNIRRAVPFRQTTAGRTSTHCRRGHSMDDCLIVKRSSGQIQRQCRECARARSERATRKKRGPLKGRYSPTHCPQGHPYDEANTYRCGNRRNCRTCQAASRRSRHASGRAS